MSRRGSVVDPRRIRLTTIVVAVAAFASRATAGTALRITCVDGGGDLFEGNGRTVLSAGFCDTDHTCDGNCTFAFNPECAVCLGDFRGRFVCSPDAHEVACPGLPSPPCPSSLPHVVLSLGNHGHAHERMRFRFGKRSFTLMLRCDYPAACPAPPRAPPRGIPNVVGDWSFQETTADTDCAPSVIAGLHSPASIRISQDAVGLRACMEPEADARGDVSPLGQGIASASTFSIGTSGGYDGVHGYELSLVAPSPTNDTTTASEQWSILQGSSLTTPPVCTRTATATMSRRPMPSCTADADCIAIDPCMRCDRSVLRCALSPLCQ